MTRLEKLSSGESITGVECLWSAGGGGAAREEMSAAAAEVAETDSSALTSDEESDDKTNCPQPPNIVSKSGVLDLSVSY